MGWSEIRRCGGFCRFAKRDWGHRKSCTVSDTPGRCRSDWRFLPYPVSVSAEKSRQRKQEKKCPARPESYVSPCRRKDAVPAVMAEPAEQIGAERAAIAGGEVGFDVAGFAHAGDGGGDIGIGENETEGQFRKSEAVAKERFEGVNAMQGVAQVFAGEIIVTPVARGPLAHCCEGAGKRAFIERDAGDDGDISFAAGGEKLVFGILVEDIVNDLDGIHESGANGFDAVPRLPAVEADAGGADFAAGFEFF